VVFLVWYLFLDNCEIIKTGFKPGAAILAQRYSAIIRHSICKIKNTFEIHLGHLYHNETQHLFIFTVSQTTLQDPDKSLSRIDTVLFLKCPVLHGERFFSLT